MYIALHNLHELPNLFNLGIHNYVLDLLRNGNVKYLFFDIDKRYVSVNTLRLIKHYWKRKDKIKSWNIPWDSIEFVFSSKILNNKCDVLLNFNSHLGKTQFTKSVRKFDGLKIYHVNDYFWNQPGSYLNRLLESVGVNYLLGYASHDEHCEYFQKVFKNYLGKVIPVPFGFSERFIPVVDFLKRKNRCVALGSVNPLRPLEYDKYNYEESANFYPDEGWFHKFRREIVLNSNELTDVLDSMLPKFPDIKDFKYDIVKKMNEYRMFVSCESIFNFPPAKYFEGPASGSVLFCSDNECNKEYGFKDQENCVMYESYNIGDLYDKLKYFIFNESRLLKIQKNGTAFVRANYSHKQIALNLVKDIKGLYFK